MPTVRKVEPFSAADFERNPDAYFRAGYVWEVPVRIIHWMNAVAITTLFVTGLFIWKPILSPEGEAWKVFAMGWARKIHFTAGFVFAVGWVARAWWFFAGNNYARSGFPMPWRGAWWRDLGRQGLEYLKLERGPIHLGHNTLAGLSYTIGVVLLGGFQIVSGLALFAQDAPTGKLFEVTAWLLVLAGGSFRLLMLHHVVAWLMATFVILHVYIVIYDSTAYRNGLVSAMITGRKFYQRGDKVQDTWIG